MTADARPGWRLPMKCIAWVHWWALVQDTMVLAIVIMIYSVPYDKYPASPHTPTPTTPTPPKKPNLDIHLLVIILLFIQCNGQRCVLTNFHQLSPPNTQPCSIYYVIIWCDWHNVVESLSTLIAHWLTTLMELPSTSLAPYQLLLDIIQRGRPLFESDTN